MLISRSHKAFFFLFFSVDLALIFYYSDYHVHVSNCQAWLLIIVSWSLNVRCCPILNLLNLFVYIQIPMASKSCDVLNRFTQSNCSIVN